MKEKLIFGKLMFGIVVSVLLLAMACTASAQDTRAQCIACHGQQVEWIDMNEHVGMDCSVCHSVAVEHFIDPATIHPVTNVNPAVCGDCHRDQYLSAMTIEWTSPPKDEKGIPTGRAPDLDLLLKPHGFTFEHAGPRSHVFTLIDHLIVDRAYGGRFQLRDWSYLSVTGKAWDIVVDTGKTLPETATAGNPVCFTCKTSDWILEWAFLGDEHPRARWDRMSDPIEMAMEHPLQHPRGCIHCHDPHSASPRIIQGALIQAVLRDGAYPYMDCLGVTRVNMTVEEFRDFRKIGILDRPDSLLMCGQCHVEYNCNPGFNPFTGERIGMDDRRTNIFPWVNVFDVQGFFDEIEFRDFRHGITGAPLIKVQHPEVEVLWGSMHCDAGVQCSDCHMPTMTNDAGITYTSHWHTSPRNYLNETCLVCHVGWTEAQAEYTIAGVQNYIIGKMRSAEFWLVRFINTYEAAERAGVPEEVLKQVRPLHDTAHTHWEWWTAENSDGFHNPTQARESLSMSKMASREAVAILDEAIAVRNSEIDAKGLWSQVAIVLSAIAIVVGGVAIYTWKQKKK